MMCAIEEIAVLKEEAMDVFFVRSNGLNLAYQFPSQGFRPFQRLTTESVTTIQHAYSSRGYFPRRGRMSVAVYQTTMPALGREQAAHSEPTLAKLGECKASFGRFFLQA